MKNVLIILPFWGLLLASCEKQTPVPGKKKPGYNGHAGINTGTSSPHHVKLYTASSGDFDSWYIYVGDSSGNMYTPGTNAWDNWNFNVGGVSGNIYTPSTDDWDYWVLNSSGRSISIYTPSSEDWDNWVINESSAGFYATVHTPSSDDFDHWEVNINGNSFYMSTPSSDDWNNWSFYLSTYYGMDLPQMMAVFFIPVYTSAIHQQGIDQ